MDVPEGVYRPGFVIVGSSGGMFENGRLKMKVVVSFKDPDAVVENEETGESVSLWEWLETPEGGPFSRYFESGEYCRIELIQMGGLQSCYLVEG